MPEPYPPYGPPPFIDRRFRYDQPGGGFLRFVLGILAVLLMLALVRAILVNTGGGAAPWLDVAGAFGIALAILVGFTIFALILAVVFGMLLPMAGGKGGDWMNPARSSTFEAAKELKVRYARGQITREEYMRILRDLEPGAFAAEAPPPEAPVK